MNERSHKWQSLHCMQCQLMSIGTGCTSEGRTIIAQCGPLSERGGQTVGIGKL